MEITPTLAKRTEFGGDQKIYCFTGTLLTASDAITFTQATHGLSEISAIVAATLTGGSDDGLQTIQPSFSGLVVTLVSKNATGGAGSDWTGATFTLTLIGK